jgi:16S rRNA processing protein RimM
MSNLINVGRLNGAYGIKGWVKVHSDTETPEDLFEFQPWHLKTRHGVKAAKVEEWRPHGKSFVAKVEGIEDRNQAEDLCPVVIAIEKSLLPSLEDDEFYWHQLEGCRVLSQFGSQIENQIETRIESQNIDLGRVTKILPTGSNDVLVVKGDTDSLDQKERLIPYIPEQFIIDIDIDAQTILVDWDPDF